MKEGFNVVLFNPEIPNNTGNIGRLCVASSSSLHLIHPLGFDLDEKRVRRAGLDYWKSLAPQEYNSLEESLTEISEDRLFFFSARAEKSIYKESLNPGDYFIFGPESTGLPEDVKERYAERLFKIPFPGKVRSFNLANTVAMILGEANRQSYQREENS